MKHTSNLPTLEEAQYEEALHHYLGDDEARLFYSKGDYDFEVLGSVVATYLVLDTNERYEHAIMTLEEARYFWKSL